MQQLQSEIFQIQNRDSSEYTTTQVMNMEKLTDREINRLDNSCKKTIGRIRDEKDKRSRVRKSHAETMSHNSSGHLKNFMRPYNPASIYSTNKKSTSEQLSLSQRSLKSSPGYKQLICPNQTNRSSSFKELKENPEHFSSR